MLRMEPASTLPAFGMKNRLRLIKDFDAPKLGQNRCVRICTDEVSQMASGRKEEREGQQLGLGECEQGGGCCVV